MALNLSTEEKQLLQAEVLWEDTASNPNLTPSVIPSANKAFKTSNKRTIGAVNELKDKVDNFQVTLDTNLGDFISMLGDFNTNPSLKDELINIAPSILEAIKLIYDEVQLLKENGGTGSSNGSFKFHTSNLTYSVDNIYTLEHTNLPENAEFELTINGIEALECTDYRVDKVNGILYWEDTATYALSEGDRIVAEYYIDSDTTKR